MVVTAQSTRVAAIRRLVAFGLGVLLVTTPMNTPLADWLGLNAPLRALVALCGLVIVGRTVHRERATTVLARADRRPGRLWYFAVTAAVAVVVVLVSGIAAPKLAARPLPSAYRLPVLEHLQACTDSHSSQPSACPQVLQAWNASEPVTWKLRGDPLAGAIYHPAVYQGQRSGWIEGTALMTADYHRSTRDGPPGRALVRVRYLADIHERDHGNSVGLRLRTTGDTAVIRSQPTISDTRLEQAVLAVGLHCTTDDPCPGRVITPIGIYAPITVDYSRADYEPEFGLFVVSIAYEYSTQWPLPAVCRHRFDTYLTLQRSRLTVLASTETGGFNDCVRAETARDVPDLQDRSRQPLR